MAHGVQKTLQMLKKTQSIRIRARHLHLAKTVTTQSINLNYTCHQQTS